MPLTISRPLLLSLLFLLNPEAFSYYSICICSTGFYIAPFIAEKRFRLLAILMTSKFRLMGTNTCVIFMGEWTGKIEVRFRLRYTHSDGRASYHIRHGDGQHTVWFFEHFWAFPEYLTRPVGVLAIRLDGGQQTKMNNNNLHHIVGSLALVKVYRSASPIFLER
jgi:hypothetical protein